MAFIGQKDDFILASSDKDEIIASSEEEESIASSEEDEDLTLTGQKVDSNLTINTGQKLSKDVLAVLDEFYVGGDHCRDIELAIASTCLSSLSQVKVRKYIANNLVTLP